MEGIVNIYRKNTTNTGDKFSTPTKYVDFLKDVKTLDFTELSQDELHSELENKIVIFGGGGFIEQEYFEDYMKVLIGSKTKLLIGWGVGHNIHGFSDVLYKSYDYNNSFDLLGVRDSVPGLNWVPCSSCLHPIFDSEHQVKKEIVIYEHKNFPLRGVDLNVPKMKNSDSFEEIIKFLGSSELVITNSYHGAYWATLLGRRVIVMQPFSSKFFSFKHPLVVANKFDVKDIKNVPMYPDALKECREANFVFSRKVEMLIKDNSK